MNECITGLLYHGGSADVLEKVKQNGLQPRAIHKGRDNWKHTVTSNKDSVYLTNAYPWHFAATASKEKVGIIYEINTELLWPWKFAPDEDFLEQVTRKVGREEGKYYAPTDWPMKKRTLHYRRIAQQFTGLAIKSLQGMGTVGYYGTIPWRAITRYVIIDWKKLDLEMRVRAVDSMVSTINYRILRERHEAFIKWFFGDPVTADDLLDYARFIEAGTEVNGLMKRNLEYMTKAMENREGLTLMKGGATDAKTV